MDALATTEKTLETKLKSSHRLVSVSVNVCAWLVHYVIYIILCQYCILSECSFVFKNTIVLKLLIISVYFGKNELQ